MFLPSGSSVKFDINYTATQFIRNTLILPIKFLVVCRLNYSELNCQPFDIKPNIPDLKKTIRWTDFQAFGGETNWTIFGNIEAEFCNSTL